MKKDKLQISKNILSWNTEKRIRTIPFWLVLFVIMSSFSCKTIAQVPDKDSLSIEKHEAPNMDYTLVAEIEIKGQQLTTDKLLNSYVITNDNELIKFSPKGKELYRYSNFDLGEISYIDASNPFNLLVFYEEYQTIEILDRTLTLTTSFDLFNTGLQNIKAVAMSSNQQIWIYDELNFKLKKLDASGDIIFESADLSNLLSESFSPSFMIEKSGSIYLSQANHSIFLFDVFGNYTGKESFNIPTGKLQILQESYVYRKENIFYVNNPTLGDIYISEIILPKTTSEINDAEIQKNQMFILLEDRLSIYTFAEIN